MKDSLRTYRSLPFLLTFIQLPEAAVEPLSNWLMPTGDPNLLLIGLVLFPFLCFASFLSSSLTFLVVSQTRAGRRPRLMALLAELATHAGTLIPVSLLTGLITVLGLPLILPFLYFLAVYLFVPMLVLSEPRQPWSLYLSKSKALSKKRFWFSLGAILIMLLVQIGIGAGVPELERFFPGSVSVAEPALAILQGIATLMSSALMSLWISYYFLRLRTIKET